jgi:hypothetical protein
MTDRITAYLVTLEEPIREDDAEVTLAAIQQIKGVLTVQPVVRDFLPEHAAIIRRDMYWQNQLVQVIHNAAGSNRGNDHG